MGICLYFIKLQSSFVAAQSSVLTPAPLLLPCPGQGWARLLPAFSLLPCSVYLSLRPGLEDSQLSVCDSRRVRSGHQIILNTFFTITTLLGVGLLTSIISFLNNDRLLTDADRAVTKQDLRLIRIVYNENLIF